jgi:hypothetical protein
MRHRYRLALSAAIVLTLIGLPAAAQSLNGTYSVTLAPDDVKIPDGGQIPPDAIVGTWSVTFTSDHTYRVTHEGKEHVTGKYTIEGDEIAFTDLDGDYACKGGDSPGGMYRVKMNGDMVTFTKVKDDECPGRVATMTPKPFTVVK